MNLIRKYGPYISMFLIVMALGFLFLPYLRTGLNNAYYAIGYEAIFNIKKSAIPSTVSNKGGPSAMLISAFVLMVISLVGLPFHRKDPVIAFLIGIALSVSAVIFFLGQVIMFVNLHGSAITGTFGLYLVASLVTLAAAISLFIGIENLRALKRQNSENRYSYIHK